GTAERKGTLNGTHVADPRHLPSALPVRITGRSPELGRRRRNPVHFLRAPDGRRSRHGQRDEYGGPGAGLAGWRLGIPPRNGRLAPLDRVADLAQLGRRGDRIAAGDGVG